MPPTHRQRVCVQVLPPRATNADGTPGAWTASQDVCQPEAAFGAYKAAPRLNESPAAVCADGVAPEVKAVAQCVASSRNDVYVRNGIDAATSDIGGWKCGKGYDEFPTWDCDFTDAALYVSVHRSGPHCMWSGPARGLT